MNTELIPRQTLAQMAEAYTTAEQEIRQAFDLLGKASERLKLSFNQTGYRFTGWGVGIHGTRHDSAEGFLRDVKRDVWSALVDRMELRRIASVERCAQIDRQIETGEGMPDITLSNLLAMVEGSFAGVPNMIEQAIQEVFNFLRPAHWQDYKTNAKGRFEIKDKVILTWLLDDVSQWTRHFCVSHSRTAQIRALDNVFHMIDGKGTVKSGNGPLWDAIYQSPVENGAGETEYFEYKCFRNRNLHLKFKRMDLVAKLNAIAGGATLKDVMPTHTASK